MSSTAPPSQPKPLADYTGPSRYADWAHDYLGVDLSDAQREILEAVADHRHVHVEAANGLGKSYAVACLSLAFLFVHHPATVYATSGTYPKLRRTLCKPIKKLHGGAKERYGIPGRYKQNPPRIEFDQDPEHYFEAARPRDPDELEGAHNDYLLAIVEEADKDAVTAEVIESMDSTLTDERDRMVVIGNPPRTEGNVVYDLAESDAWHTLQYSSFDSRNVRVDAGQHDGPRIDGMVGLSKVQENWTEWNGREWPGVEAARTAHERRDTLDDRWYRRRLGIMPPESAGVARPYHTGDAKDAYVYRREVASFGTASGTPPLGTGIDVAGPGSDKTVAITYYRNGDFDVRYTTSDAAYPEQEQALLADDRLGGDRYHPVAIDAAGEGSGLTQYLDDRLPEVYAFGSDKKPLSDGTSEDNPYGLVNYATQRAESLAALGDVLPEARIVDADLREELVIGGRTIEYGTKTLASRGDHGAEVVTVNSKDAVTQRLGHSPDYLDAMAQAAWAAECTADDTIDNGFALEL